MSRNPAQMGVRRPSRAWVIMTILTSLIAIALIAAAVSHQRRADQPKGEGQLFLEDASYAAARVSDTMHEGMAADSAIRHVRNQLTVEALSLVGPSGEVITSTSETLIGIPITNGLLQFGHFDSRFVAVAAPLETAIEVDGVVEWNVGDVVYHAIHPLENGSSLLMSYDISQLLQRRAQASGIQTVTMQLLGVALFLSVLGASLMVGRARSSRRYDQLFLESEYLRTRSTDLERHNAELDEALALSEETNRVRAEFVLMINHELRTPLTGVVTGAELLADELAEISQTDRDQLLADMVTDGHRLQEMITQMLVVARIENRGLNFTLSDRRGSEVCSEIERRHPRLQIGHSMSAESDDLIVRTDVNTLAQIIGSLADNAFTHGAADVWLTCTDTLAFEPMHIVGMLPADSAYMLVSDNGPGIDAEFLPRAFEKFEKRSSSSGTGLGLYLVSVMTEAIGGGGGRWLCRHRRAARRLPSRSPELGVEGVKRQPPDEDT